MRGVCVVVVLVVVSGEEVKMSAFLKRSRIAAAC